MPDYLETVVAGKGITTTAGTTAATVATQLQPAAVNTALQPATVTQQQPQTVIQPAFSMAGRRHHYHTLALVIHSHIEAQNHPEVLRTLVHN